jgi:hypothetical protein
MCGDPGSSIKTILTPDSTWTCVDPGSSDMSRFTRTAHRSPATHQKRAGHPARFVSSLDPSATIATSFRVRTR